jgi:S-(hydroxymethyl)glutathione dehydrogenase / alcohol dehydrogenase
MLSAILTAPNTPLMLDEIEHAPIGFGQVHVQVLATGICGAQLQEIRGEKGTHFPRLMGHEGCGRVLAVGEGVNTVKSGDKVVLHWRVGSGIESNFPRWRYYGEHDYRTSGKITTFAETAVVSENRCTAVPDETPNELCALLGCGLSTALGVIENEASLMMGESILIVGCGGLGLNLIRAARMRLAREIGVLEIQESKHVAAFEAGATVRADGRSWDVIVDTSGNPNAISYALTLLAPSGRFIMVGQPGPKQGVMLHEAAHMFEGAGKTIKATQGGAFNPSLDIPRYVGLWRSGQLKLDGIITHRLPLSEINDGIELVKNGQAGRIIIEP